MVNGNILRVACATALITMTLCLPAFAQSSLAPSLLPLKFDEEMAKAGIAFNEWLAAGDIEQIDWKIQVQPARLGTDQRLRVVVAGTVNGKELNRKSPRRDFHLLMRVRPPGGEWFPSYSLVRKEVPEPLPNRTDLEFSIHLYAAPGRYEMALLLYDAVTGDRSLLRREFDVAPLRNDPLPDAYRNLPGIEFLGETAGELSNFTYGESGRLWLPLASPRPVRVEVLLNLSRSEQRLAPLQTDYLGFARWFGSRHTRRPTSTRSLAVLKALADLKVQNGTLHVTTLDLARRIIPFQQDDVEQLDWTGLIESAKKVNEPVISATALSGRQQNASFLRETLQQRLAAGETFSEVPYSAGNSQEPLRVIIVIGEAFVFAPGAEIKPVARLAEGNYKVFYLRHTPAPFDDVERMLKPLKPARFDVETPMDLRRALRKIIDELEKL